MKNKISHPFSLSEAAYVISWETVISAIKRRKYLGEKTVDELSTEDFEDLKEQLSEILDQHLDDLLEMVIDAYEITLNL